MNIVSSITYVPSKEIQAQHTSNNILEQTNKWTTLISIKEDWYLITT